MKVSWNYYSQYMEKNKMFQTTNQVLHQILKVYFHFLAGDHLRSYGTKITIELDKLVAVFPCRLI